MSLEPERKRLFAERLSQACVAKYGTKRGIGRRLAEDMGVSEQTASKWIRGAVTPEPYRWGEIATRLGVTAQWLIGHTHELPSHVSDRISDEGLDFAVRASEIVYPLVVKLSPDIPQETFNMLLRHAYHSLKVGDPPTKISGEIASMLLNEKDPA